ncbi:MAG: right-handed parallel beta-helix repeat-containing protein [Myxococcales bacterium]|nr:right-handed parallel beta-helix repeat-containing protein [Myxococcales bacterium]
MRTWRARWCGLLFSLLVAMLGLAAPRTAAAVVVEITPADDFETAANALGPGDELVLGGGTYGLFGVTSLTASGTAGNPIVIRAKVGETPILQATPAQDVLTVSGAHLRFEGLEITGGVRGIRLLAGADFVSIRSCFLHDLSSAGIVANDPGAEYAGLEVLDSEIGPVGGEGISFGCNVDDCRVAGARIERNYVHHASGGASIEGIEVKVGSSGFDVLDNVVTHTDAACIAVGGTLGHGSVHLVEGNAMWACGDDGLQLTADVVARNNVVSGVAGSGIRIGASQGALPDAVDVVHNTVTVPLGAALRLNVSTGDVVVANNALYALTDGVALIVQAGSSGFRIENNVGQGFALGIVSGFDGSGSLASDFVDASVIGEPPNDLFPAPGSALIDAAGAADAPVEDFNRTARTSPHDVGAYEFDPTGNPGWAFEAGFKSVPEPDAGSALAIGVGASALLATRRRRLTACASSAPPRISSFV